LAEIDPSNIVSRRTRGKKIDYAKEAEAAGNELDDDEEDDEEYVPHASPNLVLMSRLPLLKMARTRCSVNYNSVNFLCKKELFPLHVNM